MEFFSLNFLVALDSQILYINSAFAEFIGANSMQIACKTAKLFTCLGGPTQLGHTIKDPVSSPLCDDLR